MPSRLVPCRSRYRCLRTPALVKVAGVNLTAASSFKVSASTAPPSAHLDLVGVVGALQLLIDVGGLIPGLNVLSTLPGIGMAVWVSANQPGTSHLSSVLRREGQHEYECSAVAGDALQADFTTVGDGNRAHDGKTQAVAFDVAVAASPARSTRRCAPGLRGAHRGRCRLPTDAPGRLPGWSRWRCDLDGW